MLHISRRIGRGQLDHSLVQPQPLWMGLLTEGFMPFSGSWSLLTGIGITAWAIGQIGAPFPVQWWLLFAGNLLASCAVALSFSFLWGALAFWAPVAAEEISSRAVGFLYQLKAFPLDGLSAVVLTGMLSVLPVGFVAWYPCRQLLGMSAPQLWHAAGRAAVGAGGRGRLQEGNGALCTDRIAALPRMGTSRLSCGRSTRPSSSASAPSGFAMS